MPLTIETHDRTFFPNIKQCETKISVNYMLLGVFHTDISALKEDKCFHYKFDRSHSSQQEVWGTGVRSRRGVPVKPHHPQLPPC